MELQISEPKAENKSGNKVLLVFLLILFVFSCGLLFWTLKEKIGPEDDPFPEEAGRPIEKNKENDLIPKNAKSPEDFMSQIEAKAEELQKKYDSNLTDFSRRKWMNLTKKINGLDENFFGDGFVILNQEVVKSADQSVTFKIKYRGKTGQEEVENEDYFYLILSADKIKNLGLEDLKADTFLTEEEIGKYVDREGFGKISRIVK